MADTPPAPAPERDVHPGLNELDEHRWSGWPGGYCRDCGIVDPTETCMTEGHIMFGLDAHGEPVIQELCKRPECRPGPCEI